MSEKLTEAVFAAETKMLEDFQLLRSRAQIVETLTEACQRSHRCWPSRMGWALSMCLTAYLILMHSLWRSERATWQAQAFAEMTVQSQLQLHTRSILLEQQFLLKSEEFQRMTEMERRSRQDSYDAWLQQVKTDWYQTIGQYLPTSPKPR